MPAWLSWMLIGLAAWSLGALVFGLVLARVLGTLRRVDTTAVEYQRLLESELWATEPLSRDKKAPRGDMPSPLVKP